MRFPYSTEEGKRGCCSGKTFDAQNLLCCPDGSIRHGLSCSHRFLKYKIQSGQPKSIKESGLKMNVLETQRCIQILPKSV